MQIRLVSFHLCPFVQRAVIALLEKGVDHEIDYIDLEQPPQWFQELSPLGKVPILLVDHQVVFESSVILDFLDEVFSPRLHPENPLLRAQHKAWISYGSELLMQQHALAVAQNQEDFQDKLKQLGQSLQRLDQPLGQGLFGAGAESSLVDVAYAPLFTRLSLLASCRGEVADIYPSRVSDWAKELVARPSVHGSVVRDFNHRFLSYFRAKGSWAIESGADS